MKFSKGFIQEFFRLSIPVMISQLMASLVNTADTVMLGALSEQAISGVAVANRTFFIYNLTLFGLTNGVGLFISQYYGANRKKEMNQIFRFGLLLCGFVCLISLTCLFLFPKEIVELFVKEESTVQIALEYVSILRFSFIPYALTSMSNVLFRVIGNTKVTMLSGCITFVINVSLNYCLIFGHFGFPELGIQGAAIATLASRIVECCVYLYLINQQDSEFKFIHSYPLLTKKEAIRIVEKSIPLMANEMVWSIGLSLIFMNYSLTAESALPALTVVDNIYNLVFVLFSGCSVAIGIFVGKRLGAGQIEEAKENAKKMIVLSLIIYAIGSLFIVMTSSLTPTFFSLSGDNLKMASSLLIIKAFFAWTTGYTNSVYFILRAGGDTKSVLVVDGLFTLLGPVLVSTLLAQVIHVSFINLYILVEGLGLIKVLLATYFYKKGRWIKQLT